MQKGNGKYHTGKKTCIHFFRSTPLNHLIRFNRQTQWIDANNETVKRNTYENWWCKFLNENYCRMRCNICQVTEQLGSKCCGINMLLASHVCNKAQISSDLRIGVITDNNTIIWGSQRRIPQNWNCFQPITMY